MEEIEIKIIVDASIEKAWELWTGADHIAKWHVASDDWHNTNASNDLAVGGKFSTRMEAKDGSFGFDFSGTYTNIVTNDKIAYTLDDDRKVEITFKSIENQTKITQIFQPEQQNSLDLQRQGWNQILISFRKYAEQI